MFSNSVISFLVRNGFTKVSDTEYKNDKCSVSILDDYYHIFDGEYDMYSDNLKIYYLIGLLTYNGYIDKNYK